jgi:hypothetical protein
MDINERMSYYQNQEGKREVSMCKCGQKSEEIGCDKEQSETIVDQKHVCCGTSQIKATTGDCCSEKTA